jgi:hypothetical protein
VQELAENEDNIDDETGMYIYIYISLCIYILYIRIHKCLYIYIYKYLCIYVDIYKYIYTCTYTGAPLLNPERARDEEIINYLKYLTWFILNYLKKS